VPNPIHSLARQEQINFLLTNRIPRRLATQFMGWLSAVESPRLTRLLIRIWRLFADDLNLEEARQQEFPSLQACFTRQLRTGARPVDMRPGIVASPCDAIVGEHGAIAGTTVFQAKGFPYDLADLIPDRAVRESYRDGKYITLRLTSGMYHRFHAPLDCHIREVTYIAGDTWNVNPIALRRIEKLFCRNERAVIELDTGRADSRICLVAVAAILVASIRLHWLDTALDMRYRGPQKIPCDASFSKGDEIGYFQHGSTLILFATGNFDFCDGIATGQRVRMGQALLSFPTSFEAKKAHTEPPPLHEVMT
jgi:phosphatidylserine decarboxylase